jgi:paraquat-inducible protein A
MSDRMDASPSSSPPVVRCRRCGRPYSSQGAGALASCPHCGRSVRPALPDNRIAAVLAVLAACVLTAGILLPFISMSQLGFEQSYSLIGGIVELYQRGYWFLGSILLVFSVIFPYLKLLGLLIATSSLVNLRPAMRQRLHRLAVVTGRYSLLDILVVAIMIVVIRFEQMLEMRAEAGTICFGIAVFMSIAAGFCVDAGPDPEKP